MIGKLTRYVNAWEQAARSTTDLCATLLDIDWNRATECPGWSVRDCVSHVIGVERELLGQERPWHQLPRDLRHIRSDFSRHMEIAVDIRRCHTSAEMLAELREVVDRRAEALRADERDPDTEVEGPMGFRLPYGRLLTIRAFDVWAHEQDIRRAVESPGNLDGLAATMSGELICAALPRVVAKNVAAPPESTVVFDVHGPTSFGGTVTIDAHGCGTYRDGVTLAPTVWIGLDWEIFVRLACGRVRPEAVTDEVKIEGDGKLARRILSEMVITP